MRCTIASLIVCGWFITAASAQDAEDIRALKLKDWAPKSMLVTKVTNVNTPLFPAVDVHNHLGGGKQFLTPERVGRYLAEMDAAGVRTIVNLDGGWGERLTETVAALDDAHPGRFLTFALIDFAGIDDEEWTQREVARLEDSFERGAKGIKFHKTLGLGARYKDGRLVAVDDPKLAPLFEVCAKHQRPVMIHTADPAAFFTPLDRFNERWHELNEHPNWLFYGDKFQPREELLKQFINVVARHPQTTFIGAHFGNNAEDLATVGQWLDEHPNLYVDIDARISELGRQPFTAQRFFVKYQDRIMFGTDTTPRRDAFRIYYRFLETDDEYFDCSASHHLQGFWMIYGLKLPEAVLAKIYHQNAERILYPYNQRDSKPDVAATPSKSYRLLRAEDFDVNGQGDNAAWQRAAWEPLTGGHQRGYDAKFKLLYSDRGIYVLLTGSDKKLTATMQEDFLNLWTEDVFEAFFWPDPQDKVYFEYEISPLGFELPIMVPQADGKFMGWLPWHYEGGRRIRKATSVQGGEQKSGATIEGWTAEVFIPYELLKPLRRVPPQSGTTWRANFYRMDYDGGASERWYWSPVGRSFHEIEKFGTLVFE